jgi:tetratricopeptide (TPR) repeat protein
MTNPAEAEYNRGQLLMQQRRYAQAEERFAAAVLAEPNNATYLSSLSLAQSSQEKWTKATETAVQAIAADPNHSPAHYGLSIVLAGRNRADEADRAIKHAINLDPWEPQYYSFQAVLYLNQRKWAEALKAADRGLEISPDDSELLSHRATAQVQLGQRGQAAQTIRGALENDPEFGPIHANAGWAALHVGNHKAAMLSFQEALRLDPDNEFAREGVVEAIKARFFLYRWLLQFFLWMNRLSGTAQTGLIIGGIVGQQVISNLARNHPSLAPFLYPVLFAYFGFVVLTWLAVPLMNLLLRLHPLGKHALSWEQRRSSEVTAALLLIGIGISAWALVVDSGELLLLGVVTLISMLPAINIFNCEAGWPRYAQVAMSLGLFAVGAVLVGRIYYELARIESFFVFPVFAMMSQFLTHYFTRQRVRR